MTVRGGRAAPRLEAFVQLGVDRLRGDEHQGDVLGLARDQVFLRDVGDMLDDVLLDACGRLLALIVGGCVPQRVTASSGNLASMIRCVLSGMKIAQSGRVLLDSVNWNS